MEFASALAEAFVQRSGLIFVALLALFGILASIYVESGGTPVEAVDDRGVVNHLLVIVIFGLYGLAGLLFGVLIWIGVPALIVSFFVTVSKLVNQD